ncbi:STAS domain-containing protein [Thermoflexibacter ruber]|uniref:Anti-sigma B factor antagonist n=1 Tax=Thermoflexibacter ruber TaxID=1003 RepID=A0A1I2J6G1_9BACT|nr:STAS domain-containing protein [Thermoflexibacter ruber]SFF50372.1 anti-sigma B factor antagonist [Thermoflexibacter ruber]
MIYHHEITDDVLLVSVNGDLLGLPEDQKLLHLAESQMLENNITRCAIDISNAHYINSTGLTILIRILTLYRNAGGEVVLINPSPSVSKVLVITKLNAIFQVLKNKEEALNALSTKQLASV